MSVAGGGGVFVSYRREGGGDAAGRLADRLVDRFGPGLVFMDVDAIEPGMDYVEAITAAVAACDVLVAVIGPGWLTAGDTRGRRLDDPYDWVRVEVGTALARGVRVIPVLVGGAVMPARGDLPEDLAGLARRNALRVRHESFRADAGQLVTVVERVLTAAAQAAVTADGAAPASAAPGRAAGAKAQARPHDQARAARLLAEAEQIASSITIERDKALALHRVAVAVAASDPGRAEQIASSITSKYYKASALQSVAAAVAASDPGRAEQIASSITSEYYKAAALSDVAAAVAATDPSRVEQIASSITSEYYSEYYKAAALSGVAAAVAATDPGRAARLFTEAERIASAITSEQHKAAALASIAKALIST
jgi:hypothetical protein